MATVMLIDGNSLTYRAFFALPTDMATASGQVTNAVFGFTSMLINLMKDHEPDHIAVAFDRRGDGTGGKQPRNLLVGQDSALRVCVRHRLSRHGLALHPSRPSGTR